MKYILFIAVCTIALYGCYIFNKTKDLLNPIIAFTFPILVSISTNLFFYDRGNYEISFKTYAIYLLGVVAFVGGCVVIMRPSKLRRLSKPIGLSYNYFTFMGCKCIALIGTLFSICYIFKAATCGVFGLNVIRNIRWYSLYIKQNSLIGKYSIIFIEVIFCVYSYQYFVLEKKDKKTRLCLLVSIVEYIIAIMTTMARTVILQFAIEFIYFFLCGIQNKRKNNKGKYNFKLVIFGLLIIYIMQLLAVRTEKALYVNEVTGKTTNWIIPYFGKQFYIFEEFISQHAWVTKGINSFGFFGRVLNRLGLLTPKYLIQIPGGQVASFITDPYTDFGVIGVLVVMLINGMLIGYIYRHAIRYSGWWLIFYSVCLYSCIIAFYAFQFAMSSQLYFAVVTLILIIDNRLHLHIRDKNMMRMNKVFGEE